MFSIRDWDHGGSHGKGEYFQIPDIRDGIALLVGAIGFFIVGGKESSRAQAGKDRTTETTAAGAGAQVMPTEPKLRVEPK
jgi:hypothetical protein